MASGHVNRTKRPNTWLHRPDLRREDSPCQPGAVHTWPEATQNDVRSHVGFQGLKRNVSNATDLALVTLSSPSYDRQFA
jgi:hypothetical protein